MTDADGAGRVRLVVVDDHQMFVQSLVRLLAAEADMTVVATAGSAEEALASARRERPDVVVLDNWLPDGDGVDIVAQLRAETGARVLLLTGDESDAVLLAAIRAGCEGYVVKTKAFDDLVGAVRAVHAGGGVVPADRLMRLHAGDQRPDALTPREREVLALVAEGLANKDVARRLGLALNTVRNHVQHINEKLGVRNKVAAVAVATRSGQLRR